MESAIEVRYRRHVDQKTNVAAYKSHVSHEENWSILLETDNVDSEGTPQRGYSNYMLNSNYHQSRESHKPGKPTYSTKRTRNSSRSVHYLVTASLQANHEVCIPRISESDTQKGISLRCIYGYRKCLQLHPGHDDLWHSNTAAFSLPYYDSRKWILLWLLEDKTTFGWAFAHDAAVIIMDMFTNIICNRWKAASWIIYTFVAGLL